MRLLRRATRTTSARPISLALQGGGAHGAFQWGALDRLLEYGALEIQSITAAYSSSRSSAQIGRAHV